MYLIITAIYPSEKVPEVAKTHLEAITKYPFDKSLGTQVVPGAIKALREGMQTIGIIEVKEGKLEEAIKREANLRIMLTAIPGYEYSIDVHYTIVEALESIRMSLPK